MSFLSRLTPWRAPIEEKAVTLTSPEAMHLFDVAPSASGAFVSAASAMRVPAVACAVGLIAESCATIPFKVYDRATREAAKDHPAYGLAHDEANPWTSAEEFRAELTTDAMMIGSGYAHVVRNGAGEPLELHRLDPASVSIEHEADGEPIYRVRAAKGGDHRLAFQDVLHLKAFAGLSPIQQGREAIGLSIAAEKHLGGFYRNAGRPSGVILSDKIVGPEGKAKIAKSWFQSHGGDQAGGTAILDEGMSYASVSGTNADAQFLENRVEQIREVARLFRIPPTMIMELSRGTWSNSEQMAQQFLTMTLRPWLVRWQAAYARALLTPQERRELYVEAVTDDLLTVNFSDRAAAYGQYRSMGAMTANEVRGGLNLPPHKDGDKLDNPYTTTTSAPAQAKPEQETTE